MVGQHLPEAAEARDGLVRAQLQHRGSGRPLGPLQEQEELDSIRPDLDGNQIMEILGIHPGREVGQAYKYLMELRMDHGPLGEDRAREELIKWWTAQQTPPNS